METISQQLENALPLRVDFEELIPKVTTSGPVMMISDSHIPYIDTALFERICQTIKDANIEHVIFGGDVFNMQAFSRHPKGMGSDSDHFQKIKKGAELFWQHLMSVAPHVYVIPGNHDNWFIKHNELELGMTDIVALTLPSATQQDNTFTLDFGKNRSSTLYVYDLPTIEFTVFGERWRVTHPKSFSTTPGAVARDLADKWGCHVAIAHGHLLGTTRSKSGRYWACDLGGLFKSSEFNYVYENPTRHPDMCPGFVVIEENHIQIYSGR